MRLYFWNDVMPIFTLHFHFIQLVYSKLSCGKPKYHHYLHSPHHPRRQAPFKQWSEDNLKLACRAVVDHGWTICKASEQFGVPRSMLFDQVNGRIQFGARSVDQLAT